MSSADLPHYWRWSWRTGNISGAEFDCSQGHVRSNPHSREGSRDHQWGQSLMNRSSIFLFQFSILLVSPLIPTRATPTCDNNHSYIPTPTTILTTITPDSSVKNLRTQFCNFDINPITARAAAKLQRLVVNVPICFVHIYLQLTLYPLPKFRPFLDASWTSWLFIIRVAPTNRSIFSLFYLICSSVKVLNEAR